MKEPLMPFHLAVSVNDLVKAREFYVGILGCDEGRSSEKWIDFNLFGHQFVVHLNPNHNADLHHNPVDGHDVPVPHFGIVLTWSHWNDLSKKLKAMGVTFLIEPYIRFKGQPGEQATMFFLDPAGNALEFKAFKDMNKLFVKH